MFEFEEYLTTQLITYLGNKRSLLGFIGNGIDIVRKKTGHDTLRIFDVFSGSGVVSRYMRQYASLLISNDLEKYCRIINECYLSNSAQRDMKVLHDAHAFLRDCAEQELQEGVNNGLITSLYAPRSDSSIQAGERVFYTRRNAQYIDSIRQNIEKLPEDIRSYFLAPLLSEASIHANTSGVFKGFYKNAEGLGKFGGEKGDALSRITGDIDLPFPVFSAYDCETVLLTEDAVTAARKAPSADIAYLDPPYNQHPYGSNYFMLNVIADYKEPQNISTVSGIPDDWNRSAYNKAQRAEKELETLVSELNASFVLISFNSEGFIKKDIMTDMLSKYGRVENIEIKYNTFRASRNLHARAKHVTEYLFLLEKK